MRTFLAILLLGPALAAAQAPPPAMRVPNRPAAAAREAAPLPVPPTAAATPTPAAAPRPGPAATPARPATGPAGTAPAEASFTPVKADAKCTPVQGRFMLAFSKTEIVDLLEQASRWTCRNFIYGEDVAKGKITLLSKTPVTAEEAYAAFLASLSSNGIALYQTGRYWKLVRTGDAKKTPIPTYTGEGETPSSEQPITRLIRLQYTDADQMRGIMGNFISPQGADLQAIPPDLLIITDSGINIRRIEKLLEAVDRPGSGESLKLIQVRFAPAKDIADKINQIFGQGAGGAAPGKPGRRTIISTRPNVPGAPGAPAAPAGGAEGSAQVQMQVTKVIPDERTNKLIVISDDKSYERIVDLVQQLDVPTAEGGGIQVIYLKNASAEDLAQTLSNLAQGKSGKTVGGVPPGAAGQPGMGRPAALAAPAAPAPAGTVTAELFSGEVKITADKAQNALVVQAGGGDMATVRKLVEKLDRPRRQVFVEAVIMEVDLRNDLSFGVGLHGAVPVDGKNGTGFIPIASSPGRVSSVGALGNVQSLISLGGFLTGYAGPVSASLKELGLNIPSLGVMIQALQSDSDVNVISTPQLLASDNEESEIAVGQNVPFQTGYAPGNLGGLGTTGTSTALGTAAAIGGLSSIYAPIQRQPVELRLKIKPQISEGDNVRLLIDESIEEIVSQDPQLGPTTAKRSVKTQIVARDQSTIVIGGLIQERAVRSVKKVPFLGSIPVLGWLFRDTTTSKQKTNLLLFLTPYIIRDEADYRRIYQKKRQEQQDFIEAFYGRQPGYDVAIDFSRKTGPYSRMRRDVAEETSRIENGGPGGPNERLVTPAGAAPVGQARPVPVPAPAAPTEAIPGAEPIELQHDLPPAVPPPAAPGGPAPSSPSPQAPPAAAPETPGAPPQEPKP